MTISPNLRRKVAGWIVLISLLGWPVSALTFAKDEPQFVLGLSWLAITLTGIDIWSTQDVRREQEDTKE
jgi:hypothetical protein